MGLVDDLELDSDNCLSSDPFDVCGEYYDVYSFFYNDQCVPDCTMFEGMALLDTDDHECKCDKYHFYDW